MREEIEEKPFVLDLKNMAEENNRFLREKEAKPNEYFCDKEVMFSKFKIFDEIK